MSCRRCRDEAVSAGEDPRAPRVPGQAGVVGWLQQNLSRFPTEPCPCIVLRSGDAVPEHHATQQRRDRKCGCGFHRGPPKEMRERPRQGVDYRGSVRWSHGRNEYQFPDPWVAEFGDDAQRGESAQGMGGDHNAAESGALDLSDHRIGIVVRVSASGGAGGGPAGQVDRNDVQPGCAVVDFVNDKVPATSSMRTAMDEHEAGHRIVRTSRNSRPNC